MKTGIPPDRTPKREVTWLYVCPQCKPARVLNIKTIFPIFFSSGSVVTYHCEQCDFKEDVLADD